MSVAPDAVTSERGQPPSGSGGAGSGVDVAGCAAAGAGCDCAGVCSGAGAGVAGAGAGAAVESVCAAAELATIAITTEDRTTKNLEPDGRKLRIGMNNPFASNRALACACPDWRNVVGCRKTRPLPAASQPGDSTPPAPGLGGLHGARGWCRVPRSGPGSTCGRILVVQSRRDHRSAERFRRAISAVRRSHQQRDRASPAPVRLIRSAENVRLIQFS